MSYPSSDFLGVGTKFSVSCHCVTRDQRNLPLLALVAAGTVLELVFLGNAHEQSLANWLQIDVLNGK